MSDYLAGAKGEIEVLEERCDELEGRLQTIRNAAAAARETIQFAIEHRKAKPSETKGREQLEAEVARLRAVLRDIVLSIAYMSPEEAQSYVERVAEEALEP